MRKVALALTLSLALLFSVAVGGLSAKIAYCVLSVSVDSPQNMIYYTPDVFVSITAADPELRTGPQGLTYSLDGAAPVFIAKLSWVGAHYLTGNTTLHNLSDGFHTIVGYAHTWFDESVIASPAVSFKVDNSARYPIIRILSPESKLYNRADIKLDFAVTWIENADWIGYSIDGQTKATVAGNTTLKGLAEGSHTLVLCIETVGDYETSSEVDFAVDTIPPSITIDSPKNMIYNETAIPLKFAVSEPVEWIAYCIDGKANVTIARALAGNTVIFASENNHVLRMYANDTTGNTNASEAISFTVTTKPESQLPELFLILAVATASLVVIAVVGASLLLYFKKRGGSQTR